MNIRVYILIMVASGYNVLESADRACTLAVAGPAHVEMARQSATPLSILQELVI